MIKQVASETNEEAGDGTTTATVLAEAIFNKGLRSIMFGADAMSVEKGSPSHEMLSSNLCMHRQHTSVMDVVHG